MAIHSSYEAALRKGVTMGISPVGCFTKNYVNHKSWKSLISGIVISDSFTLWNTPRCQNKFADLHFVHVWECHECVWRLRNFNLADLSCGSFLMLNVTGELRKFQHCQFHISVPFDQGRSYGGPGGGGGGTCPPSAPPHKKNHAYIFFNLPISRVCKYFAPHKNHAYAFLKYALKCLFVNGCSSPSILRNAKMF